MSDRILDRRTVVRSTKFEVDQLVIRRADGGAHTRHVIRHPGAVVVLALDEGVFPAQIVFIRNQRIAIGRELLELPAGTLEPGEDPALTAARELEEEAGVRAATIELLGRFYTTPGMTDEVMWAYAARGLTEVGQRLEADEEIRVERMKVREAFQAMDQGLIEDGKSIVALLLAARRGLISERDGVGQ